MINKLLDRIIKKSQQPKLFEALSEKLSLSDLQSLLLEVYQKRTHKLTPKDLFNQYAQNRFVKPAKIDSLKRLQFDQFAFNLLPNDFDIIELSPLCPLGSTSVIAPINQNNIITTIRNTEVCSDPTNMLALECAVRRKAAFAQNPRTTARNRLCTSYRVLRAQVFDEPAAFPHFAMLALCTAGRDQGSFKFEIESLKEHIEFYLNLLTGLKSFHYKVKNIRVLFFIFNSLLPVKLENEILKPLKNQFPDTIFIIDSEKKDGQGYYSDLRFQIFAQNTSAEEYFLIDGGFTNWTQQLLSNKKERLLTSGMGSERFIHCFGEDKNE